jgi:magnesium chelatase subunit D
VNGAAGIEASPWTDAALAASLFAVDPVGTGGVALRALPGPVRDRWLALVRDRLPMPVRPIRLHATDARLLGGLDLAATLRAGRPIAERGVLAEADGGVVQLAMAERLTAAAAARITGVLDSGEVVLERDGLALRSPASFGVLALDEGIAEDERPPAALLDRLAFHIDLRGIGVRETIPARSVDELASDIAGARALLPRVMANDDVVAALCGAAMALGIASIRAPLLAVRVSRAVAALAGRSEVAEADAKLAARLVLAPRATVLPATEPPPAEQDPSDSHDDDDPADEAPTDADRPLEDVVLAAAQAALPADLLAQLVLGGRVRSRSSGRSGALQQSTRRGRPAGVRRGEPRAGARLSVVETLRAAAPWQPIRRREAAADRLNKRHRPRIEIRRDDFRVTRFKQRTETTTIFVVDASGSAALHRLAEAKGAVELLLADCYIRRDKVALLAFRGRGAELLLPPTRSLVRAKRSLAGLPGGGGTPLAAAIDAAAALADSVKRRGDTPIVVLLTDGRANIARDGAAGRARAEEDALGAAWLVQRARITTLLVDTSPLPQPLGRRLAEAMAAVYLPLPHADAAALSRAVRNA